MKYIEAGWDSYRRLLPADAGEVQVNETRQAFYAGAAILFRTIMVTLDPETEPTEADLARMAELQAELDAFGQELDVRYLKTAEH